MTSSEKGLMACVYKKQKNQWSRLSTVSMYAKQNLYFLNWKNKQVLKYSDLLCRQHQIWPWSSSKFKSMWRDVAVGKVFKRIVKRLVDKWYILPHINFIIISVILQLLPEDNNAISEMEVMRPRLWISDLFWRKTCITYLHNPSSYGFLSNINFAHCWFLQWYHICLLQGQIFRCIGPNSWIWICSLIFELYVCQEYPW